jgi:Tfp pilus assembly protein PilW
MQSTTRAAILPGRALAGTPGSGARPLGWREPAAPPIGEAGFSLAELVVGIALTVLILLIALLMFDVNSRVSRVQVSVSDMQQAQRIAQNELVRTTRMAGRGGLPVEWAIGVQDNVDLDEDADPIVIGTNEVVDGSDVLTVRGVFTTPIYQVDWESDTDYVYDTDSGEGSIVLSSETTTGIFQSLTDLVEADPGEALILTSSVDDRIYAVVKLTANDEFTASDVDGDGTTASGEGTITLEFTGDPAESEENALFMAMSSNGGATFPDQLTGSIASVAILEEIRFYVRDDASAAGGFAPALARARFYPNTEVVHPSSTAGDDIADNILDLQIARAYDLDDDGTIDENAADASADEWLLNHADDDPADAGWAGKDLLNVRISTLARTDRPDRGYLSPSLADLENRDYNESPYPADDLQVMERSARRRTFTTVVDLRNFT